MYIAPLTLIGFSLTTICAGICPMGMEDMSQGQMMEHAMHQESDSSDVDCERCAQSGDELAITSSAKITSPSGALQVATIQQEIDLLSLAPLDQRGVLFSNSGPPLPGVFLVGTVILRV